MTPDANIAGSKVSSPIENRPAEGVPKFADGQKLGERTPRDDTDVGVPISADEALLTKCPSYLRSLEDRVRTPCPEAT